MHISALGRNDIISFDSSIGCFYKSSRAARPRGVYTREDCEINWRVISSEKQCCWRMPCNWVFYNKEQSSGSIQMENFTSEPDMSPRLGLAHCPAGWRCMTAQHRKEHGCLDTSHLLYPTCIPTVTLTVVLQGRPWYYFYLAGQCLKSET